VNVPVWVPVIAALVAGLPGFLVFYRDRKKDEAQETTAERAQALEGFSSLIVELRTELDRRTKAFGQDLARAEEECLGRIADAVRDFKDRQDTLQAEYDSLYKAHHKLLAAHNTLLVAHNDLAAETSRTGNFKVRE
jgi:hypothetical protein